MATRMQQRRGTVAEWAAANPILGDGEIGFERETGVIKIGDGVTAWNSLQSAFITRATVNAAGDLLVGTGDDALGRLAKGTTGQRLTVGADGVLFWQDNYEVVDAAGDLIVGSGANTVVRVAKGAVGDRLVVKTDGTVGWEPLPAATNPFVAIDAAGDLLVGSGADAVSRLAKGTNGQVLTVNGSGALAWSTPSAVDTSKVAKTGDTMTGDLTVQQPGAGTDWSTAGVEVNHGSRPAIALHIPGAWAATLYGATDGIHCQGSFRSDGALYDTGNRVYSASNPPPASGAMINQTIRGTVDYANGSNQNVTIPYVNMAKTQVRNLGDNVRGSGGATANGSGGYLQLTSNTNLNCVMAFFSSATGVMSYEITEWT